MKTLLVINPNTTATMTERLVAEAMRHAAEGWAVRGATAAFGHPVIASRVSFAVGAHAALDAFDADTVLHGRPDAVLLGCFGDPGLAALREVAHCPVAGLAQASIAQALEGAGRFAIVTAGTAWQAMLHETVLLEGGAERLVDIFVIDSTGLAVSRDPQAFMAEVRANCQAAAAQGAVNVVLGGAGFAGMAEALQSQVSATLIDCIATGTRAAMTAPSTPGA